MHHDVKSNNVQFQAMKDGSLNCQIRKNDRYYQRGDIITFHELVTKDFNDHYSGKRIEKLVSYVIPLEQDNDYVMLALKPMTYNLISNDNLLKSTGTNDGLCKPVFTKQSIDNINNTIPRDPNSLHD